jgi:hypothetical protein
MEFYIWGFKLKVVKKNQVSLKSNENNRHEDPRILSILVTGVTMVAVYSNRH